MTDPPIPDWLREIPRIEHVGNGFESGDGEWVRLADVVAAAQPILKLLLQVTKERDAANEEAERLRGRRAGERGTVTGSLVIPDWLAEVPRYWPDGSVSQTQPAVDEALVSLADVVAAAQAIDVAAQRQYDQAVEMTQRALAAEAERDATIEQARKTVDFHRDMAERFNEGRHDLKQQVRTLKTERDTLRAAVERAVAAFRAWDQTPEVGLDEDTLNALHALGRVFDQVAPGSIAGESSRVGSPLTRDLYYRLDGHVPVPCADVLTWAQWFETADRGVATDTLPTGVRVSTVFLGVDHGFSMAQRPVLFETMIFGGPHDQDTWRYATWEEAEKGHRQAVLDAARAITGEQK
jgi:hypothetical protein